MLIIDAHEDLAYNMLTFGRDYTRSAAETRRLEADTTGSNLTDDTLLGWPDYQAGRVAIVFSTLFATPARLRSAEWDRLAYADIQQANRLYHEQLDLYHRLTDEHPDHFRLVLSQVDLQAVLAGWQEEAPLLADSQPPRPVGLVVSMEGAEGVLSPSELEEWWAGGVRLIGPAWAGNRFCGGTHEPGRLTGAGIELLEQMAALGFGLDVSHMDEAAVFQAADIYPGTIIASHSNAYGLLKGMEGNRHLKDSVIQALLERDAVIGVLPFNGFLQASWRHGDQRTIVTLQHVVAQIEYICQMAGNAHHVGIGSDFDGGFGWQSVPAEIDTIADLQKLAPMLAERGYSESDIAAILGNNWKNVLHRILPDKL
jgi:membrane dipeptidase